MSQKIIYIVLLLTCFYNGFGQSMKDALTLTLQQVVEMAKAKSIASKQASTIKETKYWEYRTFKSNYQPQLSLDGTFPGYNKSFIEVRQPDGTILFQSIHNNNSIQEIN